MVHIVLIDNQPIVAFSFLSVKFWSHIFRFRAEHAAMAISPSLPSQAHKAKPTKRPTQPKLTQCPCTQAHPTKSIEQCSHRWSGLDKVGLAAGAQLDGLCFVDLASWVRLRGIDCMGSAEWASPRELDCLGFGWMSSAEWLCQAPAATPTQQNPFSWARATETKPPSPSSNTRVTKPTWAYPTEQSPHNKAHTTHSQPQVLQSGLVERRWRVLSAQIIAPLFDALNLLSFVFDLFL